MCGAPFSGRRIFVGDDIMIRKARQADLPQVNKLRIEVADMHRYARPDIFKDRPYKAKLATTSASAEEMLADDQKDLIVYEHDGFIAGFVCADYIIREETEFAPAQCYCYIKEIGVHSDFRRRGIAKALMAYLQEEAAFRGIHRMELDVWSFNQSATLLYEQLGFKPRYTYMELDF